MANLNIIMFIREQKPLCKKIPGTAEDLVAQKGLISNDLGRDLVDLINF